MRVLREGVDVVRMRLGDVRVGEYVATGSDFRRVLKLWPSSREGREVVELAPGCRVTPNHPVRVEGRWRRAGELGPARFSPATVVYSVELEGHVDAVLLGDGVVAAAIGVFCGPDFACGGWNVFTRKSVRCDRATCAACDVCVDASLDFSRIRPEDLEVSYPPFEVPHNDHATARRHGGDAAATARRPRGDAAATTRQPRGGGAATARQPRGDNAATTRQPRGDNAATARRRRGDGAATTRRRRGGDVRGRCHPGPRTTAEPRPKAYVADVVHGLGKPRPYGGSPFKPSATGSAMRHYRRPAPRPLACELII